MNSLREPITMSDNTRKVFDTLKKEWQKFLLNLVYEGMNQVNAYMDAYPDSSYDSAKVNASTLLTNHNLEEAYKELKAELKQRAQIDADWVLNNIIELVREARTEEKTDYNAIKGLLNEANKMIGGHVPEKTDITSNGEKLDTAFTVTLKKPG